MSQTLTAHFYQTVAREGHKPALMEKINGVYRSMTYLEMKATVEQIAAFLISKGIVSQSRVALLSENRPEWPMADMGILSAGLVNVPIYPTLTPEQIEYILKDSGSVMIMVSKPMQYHKVAKIAAECPDLKYVVVMDPDGEYQLPGVEVISFKSLLKAGSEAHASQPEQLQATLQKITPELMASIVYTSGTTGNPKGVMLTHENFASNAVSAASALGFDHKKTTLSFLPLSHVLERVVNYVVQYAGATVAYAESIDTIGVNLQEVKPNAFVAVPRVFEKIYNKIIQGVEQGPPLKKKIFTWALGIGQKATQYQQAGQALPKGLQAKHALADKLVFQKIREKTGGAIEFAISGGAPLMKELAEFFSAVGIPIFEGYGLTESSPVICLNRPGGQRFGTVGQVIEGVEVKIAEDGEILARGPNIMKGYFNQPEATTAAINPEGWLHTGDIGELDAEGFLKITDRKKEIIVMSNGKNVAPQPIENTLKTSPYIEQAIMVGNNQKYMGALIFPNFELLEKELKSEGISPGSLEDMAKAPESHAFLRKEINQLMKDFARYEQIKKFVLITEEMTQENGLLTPTLKYKRRVINAQYADEIAGLFEEKSPV